MTCNYLPKISGAGVSILIPSLISRFDYLIELLDSLEFESLNRNNGGNCGTGFLRHGIQWDIHIVSDVGGKSIGQKRNDLLSLASQEYVWFIDDDDLILPGSLKYIANSILNNCPDVVTFKGYMTTDGKSREDFEIMLGSDYVTENRSGKNFYKRFPNHICPMRRAIASQVKFQDISYQEDYRWAKEIHDKGLLKTSVHIDEDIYHYRYRTKK